MPAIELEGLHKVTAKGRVYLYAWRGGPRLKSPEGSKAFIDEFAAALAGRKGGDEGRISGLLAEWLASDAWTAPVEAGGLSPSTKKNWRGWTDKIKADMGRLTVKMFDRPEVRQVIKRWRGKWKATPRAADMGKQVLSALLSYAVEEGKLGSNPCFGVANLYSSDRSEVIWAPADLAGFAETASPEIMFALRLACLTGIRQGDLLKLSWSHVGDLSLEMPTGKSKGRLIYVVPLYQELRDLLAEIKAHRDRRLVELTLAAARKKRPAPPVPTTVLFTQDCLPWKSGFGASWNRACWATRPKEVQDKADEGGMSLEDAGWVLHFHDARGTAATKFHLAGYSDEEIAEILGWAVDKVQGIIRRYVKRDALLRDKIRRLDANGSGTSAVKPL